MTWNRITVDQTVMQGRPCIRGMRITVNLVVNLVANGMTPSEIIEEYPVLEPSDITEGLQYAASVSYLSKGFPVRFLADMGISRTVVNELRKLGHEAIHLSEERLQCLPDDDVIMKARNENRIILTHLLPALNQFSVELQGGALVTLTDTVARCRILPILRTDA